MVQKRKENAKSVKATAGTTASSAGTSATKTKPQPKVRIPRKLPVPVYAEVDSESESDNEYSGHDEDDSDVEVTPPPRPRSKPPPKKRTKKSSNNEAGAGPSVSVMSVSSVPKPGKSQSQSTGAKGFPSKPYPIENVVLESKKLLPQNIVKNFYGLAYGLGSRNAYHFEKITSTAVQNYIKTLDLTYTNAIGRFDRRITEISWHPKIPYMVAAACKGGDVVIWKKNTQQLDSFGQDKAAFSQIFGMKGRGPGGAIFAVRFDERNHDSMYLAGLEGTVQKWNLSTDALEQEFYNTQNFHIWYTSLDVSQSTRTLLAGDTKGVGHLSTLDGDHVRSMKLHSGKILHCEFNPVIPHLIATSSLDHTVKLWDLRNFQIPLCQLPHEKGANVARFSPENGSRLLTSDQRDEIRVYQGPDWNPKPILTISHPHRQFQHLTPITANWHSRADIIVIGRYPVVPRGNAAPPRPLDFYAVGSELELFDLDINKRNLDPFHELHHPQNDIISLNSFNPDGDMLASGQGRSLVLWKGVDISNKLPKPPTAASKSSKRKAGDANSLRFDSRRGPASDSDDSDSDDDDYTAPGSSRARNGGKGKAKATTQPKPKAKTTKSSMKKSSKK